eukprot:1489956-Prymnesium_polylepis.1
MQPSRSRSSPDAQRLQLPATAPAAAWRVRWSCCSRAESGASGSTTIMLRAMAAAWARAPRSKWAKEGAVLHHVG